MLLLNQSAGTAATLLDTIAVGDASDEAADDASDNNTVVSFLRVDPGSHLSEAGVRHRDSRPRARSSSSLLSFGDVGLVQEA